MFEKTKINEKEAGIDPILENTHLLCKGKCHCPQLTPCVTCLDSDDLLRYVQLTTTLVGSGCGSVVERSPSTPEIRGSNQGIGKLLINICLLSTVLKRRNKEKEAVNGPLKKSIILQFARKHFLPAANKTKHVNSVVGNG